MVDQEARIEPPSIFINSVNRTWSSHPLSSLGLVLPASVDQGALLLVFRQLGSACITTLSVAVVCLDKGILRHGLLL